MLLLVTFALHAADRPYTRNVAVVVYKDAEPLDWTGPYEVWNDAASFGNSNGQEAFNVYIVSKTKEPVNAQGLWVVPNYSIADAPKPDIVVFPGGPSNNLTDDPEFFAWAKKASQEAKIAESVCTGAMVLAKAGLLDGLEVTTFYGAVSHLRESYPKVTVKDGRRFIDNGKVVTTAGISAGIDGSLHLVARLLGRRVADQVARYMEYHWTPESHLAVNYRYLNPSTDARGRLMQSADMQREEKNFAEAASIYRTILKEDPTNREAWYQLGSTLREMKDHVSSAIAYAKAGDGSKDHRAANALYNAACEYALADRTEDAVVYLKKAFDAGFTDREAVNRDPDLAKLRTDKRVQEIVAAR
jgi:transcriptional regulator GlxA family with amidase domain